MPRFSRWSPSIRFPYQNSAGIPLLPLLATFCALPILLAVSVQFTLAACYFLVARNVVL